MANTPSPETSLGNTKIAGGDSGQAWAIGQFDPDEIARNDHGDVVGKGKTKMQFSQILNGLDALDATGGAADDAAKQGFLEWVLGTEPGHAVMSARLALTAVAGQGPFSPAAEAFLQYLNDAAIVNDSVPVRRGGASGRRRVLH